MPRRTATFPATGKRVEETKATGVVRFENLDFLNSNTVPAGSIVGTNSGVRFRTNGSVTVPKADIVGLSLFPGKISVKVTAVKAGEDGNVDPNTIVVVPAGEEPIALKVTNPLATKGGTHEEFPRVTQQDVDLATGSLATQLDEAFRTKLTDPSLAPPGSTLFPETGVLGEATPTVDPATLVGQEIAVVRPWADCDRHRARRRDRRRPERRRRRSWRGKVEPDHVLVPESVDVTVGDGSAAGQTVLFPVTASAEQIAVLDPDKLKAMILGKSVKRGRGHPRAVWDRGRLGVAGLDGQRPILGQPSDADRWRSLNQSSASRRRPRPRERPHGRHGNGFRSRHSGDHTRGDVSVTATARDRSRRATDRSRDRGRRRLRGPSVQRRSDGRETPTPTPGRSPTS